MITAGSPFRPLILMLVAFILCGCEKPPDPIRLGTNVWPGYEPLYLAREVGLLDEDRVRLVGYPSASEVIRAFNNHSLEAASLTLDEALLLLDRGIPIKVVLVHDVSQGADAIVARPDIEDIASLQGRKVAVESSALGAYVLTRALQLHGLKPEAVQIKHLDVNQHETAYKAGEIDAAVTFEPFHTRLQEAGAREIFTSREIPGEIIDVLVVHEDTYRSRMQDLKHLADSWFAALQHLERKPDESATIMGRRLKLDNEDVLASYRSIHLPNRAENLQMLDNGIKKLGTLIEVMREHDLITRDIDTASIMSSDVLR